MPQASRTGARPAPSDKDATAKAQEQEFKRARGAISCAECRRLKLKCDKTVPCGSCKRRGCESICPNGSLTTGQGTRFILADTDRLHKKITEMSDRIRQLEDALAITQSSATRETHPLLRPDLLGIKSGLDLHSAVRLNPKTGAPQTEADVDEESQAIDAFGTLAVRDDGAATFYGRSAGSESLLLDEKTMTPTEQQTSGIDMDSFHPSIQNLANAFPAAPSVTLGDASNLQSLVTEHLPEWPRARQLCELYLEQAPWFFGAISRRQLMQDVLPLFYGEALDLAAADAPGSASSSQDGDSPPQPTLVVSSSAFVRSSAGRATAHELALLFVVFCFGALTDPELPPAPHNVEASTYYQLCRAALNIEPVLDRPPSIATVQTLSLMGIYQGLVADEHSIETTWALMGLACKLAQSVGLHRDCARWKLSPAEVQKRRALFWELFITDCWQALATGRLPSFALPYVDAELPADPDQTLAEDGTPEPSFPFWKATWGKECVSAVVEVTLLSRAPKYSAILELDRKIRDVALPPYAQQPPPKGASLSETMKHFMPINYRELTLLYVHRCFFAQALADHPKEPLRSQYAPSFLAGYRSACGLIASLREQFAINPVQIARFWVLWTHAFSSAVMLASVVTHGGTTKTAHAALGELRLAVLLFEQAAPYGGRAVKFLPILRRLHQKAYHTFGEGYTRPTKDIFTPRDASGEQQDELSIFSGRTRTVTTKAPLPARKPSPARHRVSPSVHSPASTEASTSSGDSARASQSPVVTNGPETPEDMPSLSTYGSAVHPMLVDDMRAFDGQLDAQIHDAQQQAQQQYPAVEPPHLADAKAGRAYVEASPAQEYEPRVVGYQAPEEPDWRWQQEVQSSPASARSQQVMYEAVYHSPHQPQQHFSDHQHPADPHSEGYAVPVYGGVDGGATTTARAPADYSATAPPSAPAYILDPQQQQAQHGQYWQPSAPADPYYAQPAAYHDPGNSPYLHSPAHGRPPPLHAQSAEYAAAQLSQYPAHRPVHHSPHHSSHQLQQSAYAHQPSHLPPHHPQQIQQPPQSHELAYPAPHAHQATHSPHAQQTPRVLSVHSGTYSLQETWTSFMQHELPTPTHPPPPPPHDRAQDPRYSRR
ncbi:fungal-specific transcription factor domain-containing protein [Phanerochaete sordida]|uniref:Fungal-specific transcription factor domain-containing protein n=1 Tax=Phanerochaete sordida TaxID=48140 RepID=A0A9P3GEX3_9APHY|nr:fungal-specific transcription factor domain-containing protein [Phanerochaete sordida]